MITLRNSTRTRRLAVNTALAAALVAGCAGIGSLAKPSPDKTAAAAQAALAKGQVEKAIQLAEAVVAANPREAAYRALLGQAYLRAGRFDSAATAFDDAMKLGDNSARSALGFALSNVARSRNGEAVAILDDQNRDAIPAGDLALPWLSPVKPRAGSPCFRKRCAPVMHRPSCARTWPMPMRSTGAGARRG
jgi:tetratricopeptide (TPR) repeat protein